MDDVGATVQRALALLHQLHSKLNTNVILQMEVDTTEPPVPATVLAVPVEEPPVVATVVTKEECVEEINMRLVKQELERLNSDLDSSSHEEDMSDQAWVETNNCQRLNFLEEDPDFQKVLAEGGHNPSARVDKWALNRLNCYRKFRGMDTSMELWDLDIQAQVHLLVKFFEQICKVDGKLYPTQTLMSLYRAFHRILRKRQELRIQTTGVEEAAISLRETAMYKPVGVACVLAMFRSRKNGANLPRKKAIVISHVSELTILKSTFTTPCNGRGLQKRAAFFLMTRLCIRGGAELYNLRACEFQFGEDENGKFVRYDELLSKNYKVGLDRYQEEHFRTPIVEYDPDVVETMRALVEHGPLSVPLLERFIFYQPIDNPRTIAWYSSSRVAQRNLSRWMKLMHEECKLVSDNVTNKSGRTTCVTQMGMEGVPSNIGKLLTGHKSDGAYSRYDRSKEASVRAAQKSVAEGTSYGANMTSEATKLKEKMVEGSKDVELNEKKRKSEEPKVRDRKLKPAPIGSVEEGGGQVGESEVNSEDPLSVQTTDEYDKWADLINWEKVDRELASKGIYVGKTVNVNPITTVFGKIGVLNNCNLTISFGAGPMAGTIGTL